MCGLVLCTEAYERRCRWVRPSSWTASKLHSNRLRCPHARGENTVQLVHCFGQPFMLAAANPFCLTVHIVEVAGYPEISRIRRRSKNGLSQGPAQVGCHNARRAILLNHCLEPDVEDVAGRSRRILPARHSGQNFRASRVRFDQGARTCWQRRSADAARRLDREKLDRRQRMKVEQGRVHPEPNVLSILPLVRAVLRHRSYLACSCDGDLLTGPVGSRCKGLLGRA